MATQQITTARPLAHPNNVVQLSNDVNCGCGDTAVLCQANFDYVYDSGADTVTVTGLSFVDLAGGDDITSTNAVMTVTDNDQPSPTAVSQASASGETAAIVVDTSTLDATTGSFRLSYTVTSDNGCVSTIVIFFDPANSNEATGSSDPYSATR